MKKMIFISGLVALGACVPVYPVVPNGGTTYAQPDTYDLPAHCYYDAYGNVLCN